MHCVSSKSHIPTAATQSTRSSRTTPEGCCSGSTLTHCKTSPAFQAAQGKPAYMQRAGVRTTHKLMIFPSWELMALSWLTLRSPHPGGINIPSTRGTARVGASLLPNRHPQDKNEAHHLPTGTKLPDIYPL